MQKSPYAVAGVQLSPGICMNVRSTVHVPDGEAGSDYERRPFDAQGRQQPISRHAYTMPLTYAVLLLTVLFVIFGSMVVSRAAQRARISRAISTTEDRIVEVARDNSELTVEVMQARDSARIGYEAVQTIGMVAASGVDSIPITAPDTRPGQNRYNGSLTGSSPLPAELGILSGSR